MSAVAFSGSSSSTALKHFCSFVAVARSVGGPVEAGLGLLGRGLADADAAARGLAGLPGAERVGHEHAGDDGEHDDAAEDGERDAEAPGLPGLLERLAVVLDGPDDVGGAGGVVVLEGLVVAVVEVAGVVLTLEVLEAGEQEVPLLLEGGELVGVEPDGVGVPSIAVIAGARGRPRRGPGRRRWRVRSPGRQSRKRYTSAPTAMIAAVTGMPHTSAPKPLFDGSRRISWPYRPAR